MDYVVRREAAQAAGFLTGEALRLAVKPVHLTQGPLELLDPLAEPVSFRGRRFLESLGACHVRSLKAGPQPVLRTGLRIYHDRGCAILFCTTYFFSCDACASVWMLSYFIEGLGIAAQALSI